MKTQLKLLMLIVCLACTVTLFSQVDATTTVKSRQIEIENLSNSLNSGLLDKDKARVRLRELRDMARNEIGTLVPQKDDLEAQIKVLGEPIEGASKETPEVSERRINLNKQLNQLSVNLAQARLNSDDATKLLGLITSEQRNAFRDEILKQDSLLSKPFWITAYQQFTNKLKNNIAYVNNWRAHANKNDVLQSHLIKLGGILSIIILLYIFLRHKMNSKLKQLRKTINDNENQYYWVKLSSLLIQVTVIGIGGFLLYKLGLNLNFLNESSSEVYKRFCLGLILIYFVKCFLFAIFTPRAPSKRLVNLTSESAARSKKLLLVSISLVIIHYVLIMNLSVSENTEALANFYNILISIAVTICIFYAVKSPYELNELNKQEQNISDSTSTSYQTISSPLFNTSWSYLKRGAYPIIAITFLALVFGYIHLASFIATRTVVVISLILFFWFSRIIFSKGANKILALLGASSENIPQKKVGFWYGLFVDLALLLGIIPITLILFGMQKSEVISYMNDVYNGFQVGNITISLAAILTSIVTFIAIIFITRVLQNVLDARLFSSTGADAGFRNSFKTLLGYLGIIIAVLLSVGVLGIDFSKLAIIAGALSVGIGFGLQSIVNNFVSGLILLFERPVKVGDWVVTSSGEGFIKKISVRSTEIETFNSASVIIPNSELISSAVQNWTHESASGRVVVPVGVSYGSDMELVRETLLNCVNQDPRIQRNPEPSVYFKDFGSSSLDVELRFYVNHIADGISLRSEVRFAILQAFRENNIEIPFPQTDVHMKTPIINKQG